ncbi:hypothetical protein MMIC_P0540 [Mariprofundus micogutta]|uniref:SpoIIAA-like n=1 Tax=Mariprofundus micogutta TaxID=1921010 RepID=A0A1L8CL12_9PROT|nr:STAS/SEC14 domain-containing protein [Mariprofundus micogutta]GAV19592.1 hypothetical protein MMIC_P0540 [Mariprofundus micogutta]
MIDFDLNMQNLILTVRPCGPLSEDDFKKVARRVDAVIEKDGDLPGLIIHAESFPGWDSFAGLLSHLRFVRDHHKFIKKVAIVSDAAVLTIFPRISAHFIRAELKHFHYEDYEAAVEWIEDKESPDE